MSRSRNDEIVLNGIDTFLATKSSMLRNKDALVLAGLADG